jgi:hypothetical protein
MAKTFAMLSLAALGVASAALAGGIRPGGPDNLSETRSLGRVIAEATDHPVHIIFVHGMRVDGPGNSLGFRQGLCRFVKGACVDGKQPAPINSGRFDLGPRPAITFVNQPVWRDDDAWRGSQPYVERFVFNRPGAPPIIVDDVNWWPLLFALKCQALLRPETNLAGADAAHLKLCARSDGAYYPFIDKQTLAALLASRPKSGGGAMLNAGLKRQLVDWGLADAAIVLGPMKTYLHRAMEKAFAYAADYEGRDTEGQEFVVVSESLGSFVVMDAFANLEGESATVRRVVSNTSDLYFFANQFALLELGRLGRAATPATSLAAGPTAAAEPGLHDLLTHWATTPRGARMAMAPRPRQIIAFNDPSDLLTFDVPALRTPDGGRAATVVNLYDRNQFDFFGLFADPASAHTGHSHNRAVLRTIFAR